MPFGISSAPELFQQKLDQNIEGLPGVHRIFNDLLITGKGDTLLAASQDHDRNLQNLLERCQERNIKLNRETFMFKCSQVPFIANLLTSEGLKPDPRKVVSYLQHAQTWRCSSCTALCKHSQVPLKIPRRFVWYVWAPPEQNYSQIEKELLAHVFGIEHNHQYV